MSTGLPSSCHAGAAGQICYSLLFRIASSSLLGDRPIGLRLLRDHPGAEGAREASSWSSTTARSATSWASRSATTPQGLRRREPRRTGGRDAAQGGHGRGDLLSANGAIFTAQGKALNDVAADDVKVLVTGNPATNALIAQRNAPTSARAVQRPDPPRSQPRAVAASSQARRSPSPRSRT